MASQIPRFRRSVQNIATSATRQIHTGVPTPRPARCFHQSTLTALPRRRSFFSSNQLLASNDGKSELSSSSESLQDVPEIMRTTPQSTKRKTARSTAVKKNIRATAITKKSKRNSLQAAHDPSAETTRDETDYRHTIRAVCVAQSFDMEAVEDILRVQGFIIDPDNAGFDNTAVVHARSYNNGDVFVFSSGTVVAWSVPADATMSMATKHLIRAAKFPHVKVVEVEDLDFSTDDTREISFIRDEEIVLGTRDETTHERKLDTTMAKIAFSMGLARSTKLAVLEYKLEEFIENSGPVAQTLAGGAELSQNHKYVLQKTGEILSLRSQLNHYSELTDDLPDIFWDKESKIENYYNHISRTLDVQPRIRQLNAKIDYAHEAVSVMREMASEKSGRRLEWIIIALIAVEVLFELRRIVREEFLEVGSKSEA